MAAKILEVSHVAPFTDGSPEYSHLSSDFSLPLTFCDVFWLKSPPVERVFFYSLADPNPSFFFDCILPRLKHSLSLTLRHFPPVAGTLTWPRDSQKLVVLYRANTDAVSLTVAEAEPFDDADDFDVLSGDEPREAASLHALVPKLSVSESGASVMSLQVTLFPGKGFCIGIANHHAVLDGRSGTMFVKSWAYLCREKPPLPSELTPFYDRSVIRDPKGIDMVYLKHWSAMTGSEISDPRDDPKLFELLPFLKQPSDIVRATFVLTRNDISKLRGKILSTSSEIGRDKLRLSSFVVTYSYILLCIVRASEKSGSKVLFGFTADYRSRLSPPVPENYFGNCIGVQISNDEAREVIAGAGAGQELTALAERVSGLVRRLEGPDVLEGAEEWLAKMTEIGADADDGAASVRGIGVAGSPRFGLYGADFGWGRPLKVEVVSIDRSGAVSMAESRDGLGGVEVGVVLEKHEMEIFSSSFLRD